MAKRDDADGEVVQEEDKNENHRYLAEERLSEKMFKDTLQRNVE